MLCCNLATSEDCGSEEDDGGIEDSEIHGIAGAAVLFVLLIWSAKIMLYLSDSSGGITSRLRKSLRGFSKICKLSQAAFFFFLCALESCDQF